MAVALGGGIGPPGACQRECREQTTRFFIEDNELFLRKTPEFLLKHVRQFFGRTFLIADSVATHLPACHPRNCFSFRGTFACASPSAAVPVHLINVANDGTRSSNNWPCRTPLGVL